MKEVIEIGATIMVSVGAGGLLSHFQTILEKCFSVTVVNCSENNSLLKKG